jgi:hypothetical protein
VSFVEGFAGMDVEWWLYGPGGLAIGLLRSSWQARVACGLAFTGRTGRCAERDRAPKRLKSSWLRRSLSRSSSARGY